MSLRRRLLALLLLTVTGTGAISIWSSFESAHHEVQELFDAQVASTTRLLSSIVISSLENQESVDYLTRLKLNDIFKVDSEEHNHRHDYEVKLAFQVLDSKGNMIIRSPGSPTYAMQPENIDYSTSFGFSDAVIDGEKWRVFGSWSRSMKYRIIGAQRYDIRNSLTTEISHHLILPFIWLLPALAILLWIAVSQGLRPLQRVADDLVQRDEHNLEPLALDDTPKEIAPLTSALNRLFRRLSHSLEKERRFTSDAAHELRTPLAGLRTHAQLALQAKEETPRRRALKQLIQGVDRASHLIDQLLTMARLEPENQTQQHKLLNLQQMAIDVIAQATPQAVKKQIELGLGESTPSEIFGSPPAISILLRNLVDNAIRYTPEGGSVEVHIEQRDNYPTILVCDSGPGIPKEQRDQVFARFYRGEGHKANGCGIGLSIVKRIVDLHRAKISLHRCSRLGGLQIEIRFPSTTRLSEAVL